MLRALVSSPFKFRCVHIEHGMRAGDESREDAAAVRRLCGELGFPCRVLALPRGRITRMAGERGIGPEAAARYFRHRILRREARRAGASGILIAHTKSDLLETILMRVLRGSGPRGLASMPGRTGGDVPVIRPLISMTRQEVRAYLELRSLEFRTDSSNLDNRFLRNRIRNRLVPMLDGLFSGWERGVESLGGTQALAAAFINEEAERRVIWERTRKGLRTGEALFFSQPGIIREEAVFGGIDRLARGSLFSAGRKNVRSFCAGNLKAADLGCPVPGTAFRIRREGGFVVLSADQRNGERGFSLLIKEPGLYTLKGMLFDIDSRGFQARDGEGLFFACLPMALRNAWPGDFPPGKRSAETCDRGPVVCAADAGGTAALIAGGKILFARKAAAGDFPVRVRT
jgi:tRNA(Ile)-lysidine synthase